MPEAIAPAHQIVQASSTALHSRVLKEIAPNAWKARSVHATSEPTKTGSSHGHRLCRDLLTWAVIAVADSVAADSEAVADAGGSSRSTESTRLAPVILRFTFLSFYLMRHLEIVLVAHRKLKIVGGVYSLETGRVTWLSD